MWIVWKRGPVWREERRVEAKKKAEGNRQVSDGHVEASTVGFRLAAGISEWASSLGTRVA